MTEFSNHDVCQALERKGFKKVDGDHHFYVFYVGGRKTSIRTKVSHGPGKSYGDSLLAKMAEQLHLTNRELKRLLACPLSKRAYVEILINRGRLAPECLVAVSKE